MLLKFAELQVEWVWPRPFVYVVFQKLLFLFVDRFPLIHGISMILVRG